MVLETLSVSQEALAVLSRRWHITELSVFGSAVRGELRPDSDVDLLITFEPEARPGLFDLSRLHDELEQLFGRKVDVLTRRAAEQSSNPIRRRAILESAQVLFRSDAA